MKVGQSMILFIILPLMAALLAVTIGNMFDE